MAELQADFELLPRETLEAEMSLEPRSEIGATFEINIATKGDKGDKGDTGPAGADATINGQNAIILNGSDGISITQNGETTTISGSALLALINGLATVAKTGSYNDLLNKPIIGNATLTVQRNGVSVGTFTANATQDKSLNITVPTKASDVGALPSTTTINDLTSQAQQNALNSGITSSAVSQITTNKNNISSEVTNRQNADNNLQQQIDAITASSDVTDIVGTYEQLLAYDTSSLPPNSIIKVLQDESRDDETTYYRWVVTGGTGTWVLIGEEGPYYTKGEADSTFVPQTRTVNGKALSNNISLDASDVNALPDSTVIPTVNDATLTIQQNGTAIETFTANSSTNKTANIVVPTKTSDLNNDSGFITSAALSGYATEQWVVGQGYLTGITSGMVTTALGYTPYDSSNPNGFITSSDLPTNFVGTDGADDGEAGLVPAPTSYNYGCVLKADGTWGTIDYSEISNTPSIPTSADYWTVGTQGVSDYQTTYSKKMIFYKQSNAQDNGFRMLADTDVPPLNQNGAWSGRCLIGNERRTFLLGTARNGASTNASICGIGAHTWGSASAQTNAGWDNIYFQPDGATAIFLGGYSWRGNSGWMRILNNSSGSASYRVTINTGTNTSPAWRTVLPNNSSGTSAILFTPTVGTTNSYGYSTSINGNATATYGTCVGYGSSASTRAVGLGYNAKATGTDSIQLGQGTNSTANTLSVGLSSSLNVQLLNSSGVIPIGRIDLTQITGYDSTVAQTLKHSANGDIEWVND